MSETKDWRKICTDCQEGEPPKDCEYFGEPGGCNAPTMGKHPTYKESLQVGNAAAMRAALDEIRVAAMSDYEPDADYLIEKCNAALSSPPRNCDLFGGDPKKLHELWWEWSGDLKNCNADGTVKFTFGEWLLQPANAKGGAE